MDCAFLPIIREFVIAGSAIFAAGVAYSGLNTWRTELKGKSEYQLAKEVIRAVYDVREAFKHVRNPAIYRYEYPEVSTDHTGTIKQGHEYEAYAHVYETRWKKMNEAFAELEERFLDALVEWGSEHQDTIKPLRVCRAQLQLAINDFLERKKYPEEPNWKNPEQRREEDSRLYYHGADTELGQFTSQIDEVIQLFDDWLRPYIDTNQK